MKTRSYRRHHLQRLQSKRKHYWCTLKGIINDKRKLGFLIGTPHPCSCAMCGNPRRFFKGKDKLTMQERRNEPDVQ